jgi:hypothetical protein
LTEGFFLFLIERSNPELAPDFLRSSVPPGYPAESQTFSDIAAGIVQVAVD